MVSDKKQQKSKEWKTFEQIVEFPNEVSIEYNQDNFLVVKGPKGEISKKFKYPEVYIKVDGNQVKIGTKKFTQRQKKIINTYRAHVTNLIEGVMNGFEYELKAVYSKFPMNVSMDGNQIVVKNLLGEKVPRCFIIPNDVKIEVKKDDIKVSGIDKEKVGQIAANIEQLCRVTHLDRRVIQDGIYITKKPHKEYI